MNCDFCGQPYNNGKHPRTERGAYDVRDCQCVFLLRKTTELECRLEAIRKAVEGARNECNECVLCHRGGSCADPPQHDESCPLSGVVKAGPPLLIMTYGPFEVAAPGDPPLTMTVAETFSGTLTGSAPMPQIKCGGCGQSMGINEARCLDCCNGYQSE